MITKDELEALRKKAGKSSMTIIAGKICYKIDDKFYIEKEKGLFEELFVEKPKEATYIIRPEKRKYKTYWHGKFKK